MSVAWIAYTVVSLTLILLSLCIYYPRSILPYLFTSLCMHILSLISLPVHRSLLAYQLSEYIYADRGNGYIALLPASPPPVNVPAVRIVGRGDGYPGMVVRQSSTLYRPPQSGLFIHRIILKYMLHRQGRDNTLPVQSIWSSLLSRYTRRGNMHASSMDDTLSSHPINQSHHLPSTCRDRGEDRAVHSAHTDHRLDNGWEYKAAQLIENNAKIHAHTDNNPDDPHNICLICFGKTPDAIFMPCGHGGVCYDCALSAYKKKTPTCYICRQVDLGNYPDRQRHREN